MSQLASLADLSLSLQLGGTGTAIPPCSTEIGGELKQHICLSQNSWLRHYPWYTWRPESKDKPTFSRILGDLATKGYPH